MSPIQMMLTHEEQLIGDALRTIGVPFYAPHEGPRDARCAICGKGEADFTTFIPSPQTAYHSFHVECLPAMRRPRMTMPFAFEYLRNVEVERQVEKAAEELAKKREAMLRHLLFEAREAISRLMRAIE